MGRKARDKKSRQSSNAAATNESAIGDVEDNAASKASHLSADGPVAKVQTLLARMQLAEAETVLEEACRSGSESEVEALKALQKDISETRRFYQSEGVRAAEDDASSGENVSRRGRRLVTNIAFKQGDVILKEAPMLLAPFRIVTLGKAKAAKAFDVEAVRKAYSVLTPLQQRLLADFEASDDHLPAELADLVQADAQMAPLVRFARVMSVNAHVYVPDANKAALYVLGARANHSCDPSCGLGASGGQLLFYALRDMEAGEEVDYSYLGGNFTLYPTPTRQEQLMRVKLFECHCPRCKAPDEAASTSPAEGASREQSLRSALSAKLLDKAASLEAAWNDPAKDVKQYISDWEALVEQSRKLLGIDHFIYARTCFYALQALSTGKMHNLGGVTAERYNRGIGLYALPLIDYLKACCPLGVRRVALEPVGHAMLLLARGGTEEATLLTQIVERAGADNLRTCFYDESANDDFRRLVDRVSARQVEAPARDRLSSAEAEASLPAS